MVLQTQFAQIRDRSLYIDAVSYTHLDVYKRQVHVWQNMESFQNELS